VNGQDIFTFVRCARRQEGLDVGAGLTLVVLGAIFTFAVRADSDVVDLQVVGVILMLAGIAVMVHAKRTTVQESVVTHVEEGGEDAEQHTSEERTVRRVHGEHGLKRH
jgi:hypothetical protein